MKLRSILFYFACAYLAVYNVAAQLPQSQVGVMEQSKRMQAELQRSSDQVIKSTEVLLPKLLSLSIASSQDKALSLQLQQQPGIHAIEYSDLQKQRLQLALLQYLEKPVTLDSLNHIARIVEKALDPLPGSLFIASYPPQEITSGHIAIYATVPKLQDLSFAGNVRFGKNFLSTAVLTRPGTTASAEGIRKDLEFLNRNPFRTATALWQPVKKQKNGESAANLIIHVKEKRPWNVYAGFDNYASKDLGNERIYIGGKMGDMLNLDHRFGWLLLTSADTKSLHAGQLSYEIPLPKLRLLQLSAGYSESQSQTTSSLAENNGQFTHVRAMLQTPLADWGYLRHQWKTGFSLRNNDYQTGTDEDKVTLFQWENIWEGEIHDSYGHTEFSAELLWNPGDSFLSSSDATYAKLGSPDADYWIAHLKVERIIPIAAAGKLHLRAEAQLSDQTLLSTNQFSAAGYNRVRGYDEGTAFYDRALFFSCEWNQRKYALPGDMSIQPHVFFDAAYMSDHDGEDQEIASVGTGLRWNKQTHYTALLDIAFPLSCMDQNNREPELHFSFTTFW